MFHGQNPRDAIDRIHRWSASLPSHIVRAPEIHTCRTGDFPSPAGIVPGFTGRVGLHVLIPFAASLKN
jgi:hypothetical protein